MLDVKKKIPPPPRYRGTILTSVRSHLGKLRFVEWQGLFACAQLTVPTIQIYSFQLGASSEHRQSKLRSVCTCLHTEVLRKKQAPPFSPYYCITPEANALIKICS